MSTKKTATSGEYWILRKDIANNATVRLPPDAMVEVRNGLVLVTREGDPDDHVLGPGMELPLPTRGLAVAWALAPSTVQFKTGQRVPRSSGTAQGSRSWGRSTMRLDEPARLG